MSAVASGHPLFPAITFHIASALLTPEESAITILWTALLSRSGCVIVKWNEMTLTKSIF
jgi:hypothetical protein